MKLRIIVTSLILAFVLATADAATNTWESVDSPPVSLVEQRPDDPFEARAINGYVYIIVRQPMNVELFTILGQLISSKQLQPGTHRLRLNSRGVFLVKAGNQTRRITL